MRPGRLDEKIYIGLPELAARRRILEMNLTDIPLDPGIEYERLAAKLEGYSGADIAYLCRKVAEEKFLDSVEKNEDTKITMDDFALVLQKLKPSVGRVDLDRFKKFKAE
jgi:SpoVK/Ycf46/Vps4 family AAA+-type ATPase